MLPYNPSPVGGDLNADGVVDILDIVIVALEFGRPPPSIEDERADVNKDGIVNIFDIAIVAIHTDRETSLQIVSGIFCTNVYTSRKDGQFKEKHSFRG